ncbi:hypothetical protein AN958_05532 [Leucoagaricus sp. SymC.cos]|nr:hypothetical protein AN958_05532 [Leucoagaricus sp. SymC.cos]
MGTIYAFSLLLVECIFGAVQREVELIKRKDYDPNFDEPSGSLNHLDHLVNLTVFQEVNRQAIIEQNQALVGWALAAYVWVARIRKHCCGMNPTLKSNDQSQASEVTDVNDTKLTEALEGLTKDISDLGDRVHSVEKIRNGLLGRSQEGQHQTIQHDEIKFYYRPRSPAEEGEILEDIEFLDESQWESVITRSFPDSNQLLTVTT